MDRSSRTSRAALVLSAAALLMSAGVAGGPALADVFASNSDKVDGKHAVGSGVTANARKGKLVATSPRTGRLPNNIIAKAPNSARLGGKKAGVFQTKARAQAAAEEIIPYAASVSFPPDAASTTFNVHTVTTTKPGHLLVRARGVYYVQCSSGDAGWWLTVDGVTVTNSAQRMTAAGGFASRHLEGITDAVVPAGEHEIAVRAGCFTGTYQGSGTYFMHGGTVTVLGDDYVAPAPARPASGRATQERTVR